MQTLRERCDECGFHIQITHGPTPEAAEEALRLLDLPILDGVGLVAMDVDKAAQVCWGLGLRHQTGELPSLLTMMHWETVEEEVKEKWREEARAILTACGIIVPDEVVEAPFEGTVLGIGSSFARVIHEGDTITITRKRGGA